MALFPCASHGTRFRGSASHWYIFESRDSRTDRAHIRTCRTCAQEIVELLGAIMLEVSMDETVPYPDVTTCVGCELPIEDRYGVVIVTGYPRGDDKRQWMGGLHVACGMPAWLDALAQKGRQAA